MREGAYPPRLTTEEGIAEVIRDVEIGEWQDTFRDSEKLTPALLVEHAREVADWRIEELVEEHGSLVSAFFTDLVLRDQLSLFEREEAFLKKLKAT